MTNAMPDALRSAARTTVANSKDSQQKCCSHDCDVQSNAYIDVANREVGSDGVNMNPPMPVHEFLHNVL